MNESARELLDAHGQPALWRIRGRVQAEDGKAVPNARLRLYAPLRQRLEADAEGHFEVSMVPPEKAIRLILSARAGSMIGVHWQRLQPGSPETVCVNVTAAAWGPIKAYLFSKLAWLLLTRVIARPRVLLSSLLVLVVLLWILVDPLAREVPWVSSFMRTNNLLLVSHNRNASIETHRFPALVRDYQRVVLQQIDGQESILLDHLCTVERGGSLEIRGPLIIQVQGEGGILAHGVLNIEGQAGQPVRFERGDEEKRGGFIELVGSGAAGTTLSHVELVGGRGATYWIPRIYESSTPAHYQQPRLRPDRPGTHVVDDGGAVSRQVGGALFLYDTKDITVNQTVFLDNQAEIGGAVSLYSCKSVKFVGCQFIKNTAVSKKRHKGRAPGGGVYTANCHDTTFRDCLFFKNSSLDKWSCGGAAYLGFNSSIAFVGGCVFRENSSHYVGGAIYMLSLPPSHEDTILPLFSATTVLTEVKFENNTALANLWVKAVGGHDVFVDGGYTVSMTAVDFVNSQVREALLTCQGGRDRKRQVENRAWLSLDKVRSYSASTEHLHEGELCTVTGYPDNIVARETSYQRPIGITGLTEERLPASTYAETEEPREVDTIVIHHISAIHWESDDEALSKEFKGAFFAQHPELRTISAAKRKFHPQFCRALLEAYGVSAHFMIDREGFVARLVPEDDVAFHAGRSRMPEPDGRSAVNAFSIGIELISAHPDDDPPIASGETPAYTEAQYEALATCIQELRSRYVIKSVVGHDEIADPRKKDPGPRFDWSRVRGVD